VSKKYLSRSQILKGGTLKRAEVEVPELEEGGVVLVRELTADEMYKLQTLAQRQDNKHSFSVQSCAWCIIDETGQSVLTTADITELAKKSYGIIKRIADKIAELSGLGNEQNPTEDAKENFTETQPGDSPLD